MKALVEKYKLWYEESLKERDKLIKENDELRLEVYLQRDISNTSQSQVFNMADENCELAQQNRELKLKNRILSVFVFVLAATLGVVINVL